MKEYGGFLPFELRQGKEYFDAYEQEFSVKRLNCGRSTFWYAAKAAMPRKIYVPYLNCADSTDPFKDLNIPYEYYQLDDDLTPKGIAPSAKEAVLWINYYGDASAEKIEQVCRRYKDSILLIDHCHAFFSEPLHGVYNCYSMRKFFGVCDGAYLVADRLPELKLERADSAKYYSFILESIEKGTNAVYDRNLANEERLHQEKALEMSVVTQKILKSIDYEGIRRKRWQNFLELHQHLKGINAFPVNMESDTHMYYPLFVEHPRLRERLIENRIYTPTWWRHVPEYFQEETLEGRLARYMLMIPIDQRYDKTDMKEIADIILRENRR